MTKILIVEDNEDNIFLFQTLFSLRNYELIVARTGREGIEQATLCNPDLILMDIQLPDISGCDAARVIREALGDTVDIIAVTSYAMVGDREKYLSGCCNGYIEKPIEPEAFLLEIDKYLV